MLLDKYRIVTSKNFIAFNGKPKEYIFTQQFYHHGWEAGRLPGTQDLHLFY